MFKKTFLRSGVSIDVVATGVANDVNAQNERVNIYVKKDSEETLSMTWEEAKFMAHAILDINENLMVAERKAKGFPEKIVADIEYFHIHPWATVTAAHGDRIGESILISLGNLCYDKDNNLYVAAEVDGEDLQLYLPKKVSTINLVTAGADRLAA